MSADIGYLQIKINELKDKIILQDEKISKLTMTNNSLNNKISLMTNQIEQVEHKLNNINFDEKFKEKITKEMALEIMKKSLPVINKKMTKWFQEEHNSLIKDFADTLDKQNENVNIILNKGEKLLVKRLNAVLGMLAKIIYSNQTKKEILSELKSLKFEPLVIGIGNPPKNIKIIEEVEQ